MRRNRLDWRDWQTWVAYMGVPAIWVVGMLVIGLRNGWA